MAQNEDVKDLADQYKRRVAGEQLEAKVFLEKRELLKTESPKLWSDLSNAIKSKCEAFNQEIGEEALRWQEVDSHHWKITRQTDKVEMEGTFVSPLFLVTFTAPRADLNFELHFSSDSGKTEFVHINPKTKVELINKIPDIAHGLLRDFLKN